MPSGSIYPLSGNDCLHLALGRKHLSLVLVWSRLVSVDHLVLFREGCSCTWTICLCLFHLEALKSRYHMQMLNKSLRAFTALSFCALAERKRHLILQWQHNCDSWWNMTPSGLIFTLQVQWRRDIGSLMCLVWVNMPKYNSIFSPCSKYIEN